MSLYLEHFGLREPPFRITPGTDFFFSGANRGSTLEALLYAITQEEGIVKVTGEVGSGKTMLCRMLLERLPADVDTLYLANPSLSRHEILVAVAAELGIPPSGTGHSAQRAVQEALLERYAAGRRVVLMVDEAHAMPTEALEEVRLLSNLESNSAKLLQIALFAQPELDARLAARDLCPLRERITQHFTLAPLKHDDVPAYLDFRLRAAGYRGSNPFTPRAAAMIARRSEGLSRRINILADKALLAAYAGGTHQVASAQARTAIQDARFVPLLGKRRFRPGRLAAATAAAFAIGTAVYFHAAPWPSVHAAPEPGAKADDSRSMQFGPLTHRHLAAFDTWLASAHPNHYFIQLLGADAASSAEIEAFLVRAAGLVDPAQLRAYRSSLSGRDRVGIVYGDYESREAALTAMQTLPEGVRSGRPYPRQVTKLQP